MEKPTRFSKRFEALGTALTDRYRYNPYLRSTVLIILLQVILTVIIVLAFGAILKYQQEGIVGAISNSIQTALSSEATSTPSLDATIKSVRSTAFEYAFFGLILLTVFFGFLAARYALRPTRDSLQFQKRFIGNMAHEIRTPLAIIKTNTEVGLMDPRLPTAIRATLETTNHELDRISETINNLLSFETLVRPSRISLVPLDVSAVARDVVTRHESMAKARDISLTVNTDRPHRILANATGIDQVFTNLLKNALNYTPANGDGSIAVTVTGDAGRVVATVVDTGIGIEKNDLQHIFQPFYRADTSRARGVGSGSSGLGLAIVHEIVRGHGGSITVRSTPGRGTSVEVSFPALGSKKKRADEDDVENVELRLS